MNVPVGICSGTMDFEMIANERLHLPDTLHLYHLTGRDYQKQTTHNEFKDREGRRPGLFMRVSKSKNIPLLVFSTSHTYLHYPMSEEMKLTKFLCLDEMQIPTFPIFNEYEYL